MSFHPRTESVNKKKTGKLTLRDSTAMAVGGMIGGGIFSVLGVTVSLAGHLAVGCFILGAIVAIMTAHSFSRLSLRAGKSGGLFIYLRGAGYPRLGAYLSWLLIFGYVVALAVYSYTFGHYAANVTGQGEIAARTFSALALIIFLGINLRGVSSSAITEDIVVFIKVIVLAIISIIGFFHFSISRFTPIANNGFTNVLIGATTIFVAYEGFELLSYDYDDIENPKRNLPKALYLSVGIVALIYVIVTIGSQLLVSDSLIVGQKEVAFASVGQAAMGTIGKWIATGAALLATCSAINATLFSTARQMHEISTENELPKIFSKTKNSLPVSALVLLTIFSVSFAMLPGILELLTFGSAIFLMVFAATNYLAFLIAESKIEKVIGLLFLALHVAQH